MLAAAALVRVPAAPVPVQLALGLRSLALVVAPARLAHRWGSLVQTRPFHLISSAALVLFFLWQDIAWAANRTHHGVLFWPGSDAHIYYRAAEAWVTGGDPWRATFGGLAFAGPPPTLLAILPFLPLGEELGSITMAVSMLAAGIWLLWRLRLPAWWILWPPMVEALWVGSLNTGVVALMVAGGTLPTALATFTKVFAFLPAFVLDRRRGVMIGAALTAATIPFMPWGAYLDHGLALVDGQNNATLSTWGAPMLMVLAVACLAVMGRKRAAWLIVPAVWPFAQLNYTMFALPVMTPVLGLLLAFREPWAVPAAMVVAAVAGRLDAVDRRPVLHKVRGIDGRALVVDNDELAVRRVPGDVRVPTVMAGRVEEERVAPGRP